MESFDLLRLFQGLGTLAAQDMTISIARIGMIFLGMLLFYLGKKGVLEGLLMILMGLGMIAVNAGVLFLEGDRIGTLHLNPLVSEPADVINELQIYWLQPVYTFTFSNGLIACLVFMGIGVLLDVGFVMARPFQSMILALFGELGTFLTFPIAIWMGLTPGQAASVAMIGGADGPMVLFTSLILAKDLFVPITVVGYLYLGLTYGGYPYLIKLLVPKDLRGIKMPIEKQRKISSDEKLVFCVVTCTVLCLLFPVAAPLFLSLFLGICVKESGLTHYITLFSDIILYGATFFLGLLLGILCEANTILNPKVLILLVLGILALVISAIGGLMGGYLLYFLSGKKYNPVIGIAAVSCVPTCAKVAQKVATEAKPDCLIMPQALGANISGVITSAIIAAAFVTLLRGI